MTIKAVLTGHSRGLGAAIAAELLSRGIPVLGIARQSHLLQAGQHQASLQEVALDLADTAKLGDWIKSGALQAYLAGSKTVLLINNAGTVQPVGPLAAQDPGRIAQAIQLNVAAPMMLSSALATVCQDAGANQQLRILHVSSGAGRSAYAGWSIYCATKAALDQHARAVALDALPNVRICSLAPGIIDTDMQAEIRATPLERFPMRDKFEDLKRSGQLVEPAACAQRLVAFLLHQEFGRMPVADLRG